MSDDQLQLPIHESAISVQITPQFHRLSSLKRKHILAKKKQNKNTTIFNQRKTSAPNPNWKRDKPLKQTQMTQITITDKSIIDEMESEEIRKHSNIQKESPSLLKNAGEIEDIVDCEIIEVNLNEEEAGINTNDKSAKKENEEISETKKAQVMKLNNYIQQANCLLQNVETKPSKQQN